MVRTKRWTKALAGVAVLLLAGMVYGWSVISDPIAREFSDWTKAQLSFTFTVMMMLFCMGCLFGGVVASKLSAGICLRISALLFLVGFLVSANMHRLWLLYLGFGGFCGFGAGLTYNTVMGTVSKWFPDKPGLISGILLMGYGISSFLVGTLFQLCTPDELGAWRRSFIVLGIVIAAVVTMGSFIIRKPEEGFTVDGESRRRGKLYRAPNAIEAAPGQMLRKSSFWFFFFWVVVISVAGLALTSQASGIAREASPGISADLIAVSVGIISIANGVSRILMGGLFDILGRRFVMQAVNVLFTLAGAILLTALRSGSTALLLLGFIVGGVAFGGVTPSNAAFIQAYYGKANFPINFSIINLNLLFSASGSTLAGAMFDGTGSYRSTSVMLIVCAVVGAAASLGISLADRRETARQEHSARSIS